MLMDLHRNMQELKEQVGRENTGIKQSLEGCKSRQDEVQEAIDGIEIREQVPEKLTQRETKGSPGMKEY